MVINITEQSNVRSQNGSCASNSLTLVFLNFLRFYCLPRSLEVCNLCFFPGTFKFIQGLACGNSHGYRPFFKNTIILFVVPPKFALALFSISLGAKGLLSTHSLASFVSIC